MISRYLLTSGTADYIVDEGVCEHCGARASCNCEDVNYTYKPASPTVSVTRSYTSIRTKSGKPPVPIEYWLAKRYPPAPYIPPKLLDRDRHKQERWRRKKAVRKHRRRGRRSKRESRGKA